MIFFSVCVFLFVGEITALYHEKSIKYLVPEDLVPEDSLFGYSAAFHTDKRLIIGAPKADFFGQVYSCDVQTLKCKQLNVDINQAEGKKNSTTYYHQHGKTEKFPNWWLGATVVAGSSFFAVCAPREVVLSKVTVNKKPFEDYGSFGQCFIEEEKSQQLVRLQPLSDAMRFKDTYNIETRMDSFGWSMSVAIDDTILVGGPAFHVQDRGAVEVYIDPLRQMEKSPKSKNKYPYIIKTSYYKNIDVIRHNFGYSVATGNYFSENKADIVFAIGSNYGKDGLGMVLFMNKPGLKTESNYFVITDKVPGSLFAAALCSANVDGDNRMDLLVGAPAMSGAAQSDISLYNFGAVYVYTTEGQKKLNKKQIIHGNTPNGYFGFAITNIGDTDGDNKDDIVIGAPFENEGQGAIYLYSGADLAGAKVPRYRQMIQGHGVGYFGFSLTPLKDFDYDGGYGLAVGMPANNSVAKIQFMILVKVDLIENGTNLEKRKNEDYFVFQSCLNISRPLGEKPRKISGSLQVNVQISHEYAKLASPNGIEDSYKVDLQNVKGVKCTDIKVLTPQSTDRSYSKPIGYTISVTQPDDPRQDPVYDGTKALLLEHSGNTKSGTIWATSDCQTPGQCKPMLHLTLTSTVRDTYVIGSSDSENMTMHVLNTGETAYEACVLVRFVGVSVRLTTSSCHVDSETLVCTPPGQMKNNTTWDIKNIVLDTSSLTSLNKDVSIIATLYNDCNNKSSAYPPEVNKWNVTFDAKDVTIEGKTLRGNVVQMTEQEMSFGGKQFEHAYSVQNTGITKWVDVSFIIEIEKQAFYMFNNPRIHGNPNACADEDDTSNSTLYRVTCSISELGSSKIDIYFTVHILPRTLDTILPTKNVTVTTNFTLLLNDEMKLASITTVLMLQKIKVPLWIILAACLFGLALVGFIIFILYECGFLRRKKKEDLRRLKRKASVRLSMRNSSRASDSATVMSMAELRAAIAEKRASRNRLSHSVHPLQRPESHELDTNTQYECLNTLNQHEVQIHNEDRQ